MAALVRVEPGTEFVSRDLDLWACQRSVTLDFSRLGKPTRQRVHQNLQRVHPRGVSDTSLGNLTPHEFAQQTQTAREIA